MRKINELLLLIVFFFFNDSIAQSYDAIINLGGDCQVAYQMYITGLRQYALPFDILITPCRALFGMLENRFDGFMARDNFELCVDEKGYKYILDKKYGTRLIHDFKLKEDFLDEYEEVAAKYQRRINRFMHLIITSEYPLFIRKKITKEQATELRSILLTVRAGRPFVLAALDSTPEIGSDWQEDMIRNYYLRQPEPYTWKGDDHAWKEIFSALQLELANVHASVVTVFS